MAAPLPVGGPGGSWSTKGKFPVHRGVSQLLKKRLSRLRPSVRRAGAPSRPASACARCQAAGSVQQSNRVGCPKGRGLLLRPLVVLWLDLLIQGTGLRHQTVAPPKGKPGSLSTSPGPEMAPNAKPDAAGLKKCPFSYKLLRLRLTQGKNFFVFEKHYFQYVYQI
jgi:hypothetical protein